MGTVAAGVAKAHADVVLISGHDGGTGASPLTSIKHAGVPWELGLAETQQVLVLNDLRDRIVVQVDGQMKTGRDVVIAALMGAEEFGFATAPLVVLGCIMMRVCHLNTCPVGVATQDPELRRRFAGKPEFVENFFRFIAREVREYMAALGFRRIDEMIGRVDGLDVRPARGPLEGQRASTCRRCCTEPEVAESVRQALREGPGPRPRQGARHPTPRARGRGDRAPAARVARPADPQRQPDGRDDARLGGDPAVRRRGAAGRHHPDQVHRVGRPELRGVPPAGHHADARRGRNDYFGKGLSGGRLVVYPPRQATFVPEENIIVGNVSLYGATGGEAFVRGVAGERFAVRNSGALGVVEGVGDHGCEYMTGGRIVVLGRTGRNFAAGMSGGIAYVLDLDGTFRSRCNLGLVDLGPLEDDDVQLVRQLVARHVELTGSTYAAALLDDWPATGGRFVKIMPRDYRRVLLAEARARAESREPEFSELVGATSG